jgi:LytS/YehU family sensor histidine kinase
MFMLSGYSRSLQLMIELCAAYVAAFLLLAALSRIAGPDAPWRFVLPTAAAGAVLGGYVAAAIALAPDWDALASLDLVWPEWQIGAAFSAFFVGLSLAAAAVRQREQTEFETRQRLLEARLQMLAARIEPHFLMNTLANLRYLVRSDAAKAYDMLDHLSEFLQGALERSRDLNSTLGQELQIIESYLSIMQLRLGDKLSFSIDVPKDMLQIRFPSLLLQTLVENAVMHGIEPADKPGVITVSAEVDGRVMRLTIADDGAGFTAHEQLPGHGVGLRNVRDRLETFFLGRASFDIGAGAKSGTEATLIIPREVA